MTVITVIILDQQIKYLQTVDDISENPFSTGRDIEEKTLMVSASHLFSRGVELSKLEVSIHLT